MPDIGPMIALYPQARISANSNAAQVGACGGAEEMNLRSGDRKANWIVGDPFCHRSPHRASGALPMSSQVETVTRARAVRMRLIAIAEACYVAGVPLPMRDELARICGATRRQIDRHISYLQELGQITTQRRANRAYVLEVVV